VLVVLVKLTSCKKITDNWKTFTIKEGKHRSTYALNYSKDTMFGWNIEFDLENSIRFGWRWLDDSLEIHWFKHEHGKFSFDLIKRVSLCKEHYYELTIFRWDYKMGVDGTYVYIPRNCVYDKRRYQLYPYFGGEETAPHDIKIKIKKDV